MSKSPFYRTGVSRSPLHDNHEHWEVTRQRERDAEQLKIDLLDPNTTASKNAAKKAAAKKE
tara:strand:+ start:47 stop:229 length:183 start_codon:yes stop_codon:yes gene_type:complete